MFEKPEIWQFPYGRGFSRQETSDFQDAQIEERYDLSNLSTKGLPVKAGCDLINALERAGVRIFVLHDFDLDGFKIVKSLREGVRLSNGTEVFDLGLRLLDLENLESEPVEYKQGISPRFYLDACGATAEEIDFLVSNSSVYGDHRGRRVEINAMTSEQFIEWLEKKFKENGITKYIPDSKMLQKGYKRARYLSKVQEVINEIQIENDEPIPENLAESIKEILEDNPTMSWDEAIWELHENET